MSAKAVAGLTIGVGVDDATIKVNLAAFEAKIMAGLIDNAQGGIGGLVGSVRIAKISAAAQADIKVSQNLRRITRDILTI